MIGAEEQIVPSSDTIYEFFSCFKNNESAVAVFHQLLQRMDLCRVWISIMLISIYNNKKNQFITVKTFNIGKVLFWSSSRS